MDVIVHRLNIPDARQRINIVRLHRIGKLAAHHTSNKPLCRPIMVRFHYFPHSMEVFGKRGCLKESLEGSSLTAHEVATGGNYSVACTGISQDFPINIVNKRNQLKQVLKIAKRYDDHAFLKVDKLVFKGIAYTVQECYNIKEFDIHTVGTWNKTKTVLFHGRFSPFSNFYPCVFSHNGIQYHCVEQFYQYQKALTSNKGLLATKILLAQDPVEMKHLGDSIDRGNWSDSTAIGSMMTGLKCKFEQNPALLKLLAETNGKELIECNAHDEFWGNGLSIRDKMAAKGKGKNHLGMCLMKVREDL